VTRCGPAWPARVAASLCEAAGASELVARDNQVMRSPPRATPPRPPRPPPAPVDAVSHAFNAKLRSIWFPARVAGIRRGRSAARHRPCGAASAAHKDRDLSGARPPRPAQPANSRRPCASRAHAPRGGQLSAPLFDSARWARSFQAALAHVWHRFCAEGRAGLADFSPPDFGPSGAMLDLQARVRARARARARAHACTAEPRRHSAATGARSGARVRNVRQGGGAARRRVPRGGRRACRGRGRGHRGRAEAQAQGVTRCVPLISCGHAWRGARQGRRRSEAVNVCTADIYSRFAHCLYSRYI